MTPIVLFNAIDEFLVELERDFDVAESGMLVDDRRIARGIVRLTNESRRPAMMPYGTIVVLASYVNERRDGKGGWVASELVELREFAGQIWESEEGRMGETNARTTERSEAVKDAVRQACDRLGLECRGGSYQAMSY